MIFPENLFRLFGDHALKRVLARPVHGARQNIESNLIGS
jgi:hypothetical protein